MGQPAPSAHDSYVNGHHETKIRIEHLEGHWRNLKQTVPPFAEEWWVANYDIVSDRIASLRKTFDSAGPTNWPAVEKQILTELAALENLVEEAKSRLGEHTAAGRAKATS
jgi:hypothetical protein